MSMAIEGKEGKSMFFGLKNVYKIEVRTGDDSGAGTDSNITIQLYGERNISREFILDKSDYNDFERGDDDCYFVQSDVDLGDIYRIAVRSDCAGKYSGWLLSSVKVTRMEQGASEVRFIMPSGTWLEDTAPKYFNATSGYNHAVPVRKETSSIVLGDLYVVPANFDMERTSSCKVTCSIDVKKVETTDATTGASIGASVDAISATIDSQIEESVSNEVGQSYGKEVIESQTVHFPVVNEDRVYRVIWNENSYDYDVVLGNTKYHFGVPVSRTYGGYKEENHPELFGK